MGALIERESLFHAAIIERELKSKQSSFDKGVLMIDPEEYARAKTLILRAHEIWLDNNHQGIPLDLSGANLRGANFAKAYMYGANLAKATLIHANMSSTNLDWVNLSEANLTGARMSGAHF
jgi:hypothetical protein